MTKRFKVKGEADSLLVMGVSGVFVVGLIVLVAVATVNDRKRWAQFKVDHHCRVVAKKDGQYVYGVKGSWTADQRGWLCDDGVTYFKED